MVCAKLYWEAKDNILLSFYVKKNGFELDRHDKSRERLQELVACFGIPLDPATAYSPSLQQSQVVIEGSLI